MMKSLLMAALLVAWAVPPAGAQQVQQGPTAPASTEQPSAAAMTRGGAAPAAAGLSQEQVRRIQQRLGELGFDPGPVDGIWGERTRGALRDLQAARGLEPTGDPTGPTLAELGVEGGDGQRATAAATGSGMEVTGIVTSADDQTREIVIDGETFVMPEQGGGAALMPNEGDEVTLFYREEGGQKLITRIGQKRQ
jgi:peptidoglycan hydrolase-like protein with peptidoglycan-binding domain